MIFELGVIICLAIVSFLSIKKRNKSALIFQTIAVILLSVFIIITWVNLQRAPFKTIGETRIWYSFFLMILNGIVFWRWKNALFLIFINTMACIFIVVNICKPELQSHVLIPVLQSVWFIPHVAIYMFAYAAIGCAFVSGFFELFTFVNYNKRCKEFIKSKKTEYYNANFCEPLIVIGTVALTFGICFGAIWAKKAWGQYWSWDIKENAALITWIIFFLYIHLQKFTTINRKYLLIILMIGFLSLNFTWYGVNFLPAAQKSPHTFYNK